MLGILGRDPPLKDDAARAGDREQISVPRGLRRVPGQCAVEAVARDAGDGAGDVYPAGVFSRLGQQTTRIFESAAGDAPALRPGGWTPC